MQELPDIRTFVPALGDPRGDLSELKGSLADQVADCWSLGEPPGPGKEPGHPDIVTLVVTIPMYDPKYDPL
jgi:hypothetical protein